MIHRGQPWPAADRSQPHQYYARFLAGWDEFLEEHHDGIISGVEIPSCGPLFSNLPKPAIKNLLLRMMHPDPSKRVSIHDAVGDRWVKNIDCCSFDEESSGIGGTTNASGGGTSVIDAAGKESCKLMGKMSIKKCHNHLPPKESKLPHGMQHRFDMGHGWS